MLSRGARGAAAKAGRPKSAHCALLKHPWQSTFPPVLLQRGVRAECAAPETESAHQPAARVRTDREQLSRLPRLPFRLPCLIEPRLYDLYTAGRAPQHTRKSPQGADPSRPHAVRERRGHIAGGGGESGGGGRRTHHICTRLARALGRLWALGGPTICYESCKHSTAL